MDSRVLCNGIEFVVTHNPDGESWECRDESGVVATADRSPCGDYVYFETPEGHHDTYRIDEFGGAEGVPAALAHWVSEVVHG